MSSSSHMREFEAVEIDPTLAIHEEATQNRDGLLPPGAADYLDHMPIGYQRSAKKAMVDASAPYDDQAYRGAFEKIVATVKMLNGQYHRELELYQRAGMTAADILAGMMSLPGEGLDTRHALSRCRGPFSLHPFPAW